MDTSPPPPTHRPVSDNMNKHGDGTEAEAGQNGDLALPMNPNEGGGGNDIAAVGTAEAHKKRENWGPDHTDQLLGAFLKHLSTPMEQGAAGGKFWDVVAKTVPGRTAYGCKGRMDTLKKSFRKTKKYCNKHGKEFNQLEEKDFGKMKVSPRLTETWYNQIRDYCPPRERKKLKVDGAGSSLEGNVFASDSPTLGEANDLESRVLPDENNLDEPALADPPASQPELPALDPSEQANFPTSPHWSDLIDYEEAIAAPLPRSDACEAPAEDGFHSL